MALQSALSMGVQSLKVETVWPSSLHWRQRDRKECFSFGAFHSSLYIRTSAQRPKHSYLSWLADSKHTHLYISIKFFLFLQWDNCGTKSETWNLLDEGAAMNTCLWFVGGPSNGYQSAMHLGLFQSISKGVSHHQITSCMKHHIDQSKATFIFIWQSYTLVQSQCKQYLTPLYMPLKKNLGSM